MSYIPNDNGVRPPVCLISLIEVHSKPSEVIFLNGRRCASSTYLDEDTLTRRPANPDSTRRNVGRQFNSSRHAIRHIWDKSGYWIDEKHEDVVAAVVPLDVVSATLQARGQGTVSGIQFVRALVIVSG